jgi:tetratricopeptide (TPR) repeat protein
MSRSRAGDGSALVAIVGAGGVGKSALAVAWAHSVAADFPDGQLYVNLRGFDPVGVPVPPDECLAGFLDALGVPAERRPVSQADRAAAFRTLTADKKLLVLLDNAADSHQVRELLPAGSGCLTVVTSRTRLAGLVASDGARPVRLAPLAEAEAFTYLQSRLGADRVERDRVALGQMVAFCGGLPLALAVVTARLVLEPHLDATALAARLGDSRATLSELALTDSATDPRAVFSWSHRRLTPGAAALFRTLGLHPGPGFSAAAALAVAASPGPEAEAALRELADTHLLSADADGRYRFHDLVRLYAVERAEAELDEAARRDVRRRILNHYLGLALQGDLHLVPNRPPLPPVSGAAAPSASPAFADAVEATRWFDAERDVLVAAAVMADEQGFDEHAWQLPWTMGMYLDRTADHHTMLTLLDRAAAAAGRLGDTASRVRILCASAQIRSFVGGHDLALELLNQAREELRGLDDVTSEARAEITTAMLLLRMERHDDAHRHAEQAIALMRRAGNTGGEGQAVLLAARALIGLGRFEEALERGREALDLNERVGFRTGQGRVLDAMAFALRELGRFEEALLHHHRAATTHAADGDHYYQALTLARAAQIHATMGDAARAREVQAAAWTIVDNLELGDDDRIFEELAFDAGGVGESAA